MWTGRSSREALGQQVDEVFQAVGSNGDRVGKPWEPVLSAGSLEDLPAGAVLVTRTGEKRPISGSIAPIRDHKGAVAGAVLVFGRRSEPGASSHPVAAAREAPSDNGIDLGSFKMIAVSAAMKQLLAFARRVAQSEVSTILLEGESGTGKDVLAQFLHYYGRRHEGPFVALELRRHPGNAA